jgi:N,N-dimethylformamidase
LVLGYVSDEDDVAVAGVSILAENQDGDRWTTRSDAGGGIALQLPDGAYTVTLSCSGFGSKRSRVRWRRGDMQPHRFRILRDAPLAYMWPKWCRSGDVAVPQVHAVTSFKATVWRYGLDKEKVLDIGWVDEHGPRATMQITPDGDYTQEGVAWGTVGYSGNRHHARAVVAPSRSGLYYLHVTTQEGDSTSAPWVVAPASPTSRIAVIASTNNWNAYNEFGGRSNYLHPVRLPERPTVNARQDLSRFQTDTSHADWKAPDEEYRPLSFQRPEPFNVVPEDHDVTDPMPGYLSPSLAPMEWRLLAWLEREGYSYDLYADAQLHNRDLDLDAYEVLMLSGHPEYWSGTMIESLESWIEKGGRLLSLGGNSLNCEVTFEDPSRLCFKTFLSAGGPALGMPNPDDPSKPFDSRLHRTLGRSEASLLGVSTTLPGFGTAAPYEVVDPDHWIFAGTGMSTGDLFGAHSLCERCPGASGWETDKRTPSSPPSVEVLARGTNADEGGAELVFHRLGGGAVISAGSITYAASLLVDDRLSMVTANMVTRFLDPTPFDEGKGSRGGR